MKTILISIYMASVFGTMQAPEQTLGNLEKAIDMEANDSRRFSMYAKQATDEGYMQEAKLFKAVSLSDSILMENHKKALKQMGGQPQQIQYDKITVKTTKENLKEPIKTEKKAADKVYPKFIEESIKDKADAAEKSFRYSMTAQEQNQKLFQTAYSNFGKNKPADYYVSNKTGEVMEEAPNSAEPMAKMPGEKFIKF
jgi:rubrerythrin